MTLVEVKTTLLAACLTCLVACLVACRPNVSEAPSFPEIVVGTGPESGEIVDLSEAIHWHKEICANFDSWRLLRPGDFIDQWENAALSVDGRPIRAEPWYGPSEDRFALYDETTVIATEEWDFDDDGTIDEIGLEYEILAEGPTESSVCWPVKLRPGRHTATVRVWTSTGEEYMYSWTFEMVR